MANACHTTMDSNSPSSSGTEKTTAPAKRGNASTEDVIQSEQLVGSMLGITFGWQPRGPLLTDAQLLALSPEAVKRLPGPEKQRRIRVLIAQDPATLSPELRADYERFKPKPIDSTPPIAKAAARPGEESNILSFPSGLPA